MTWNYSYRLSDGVLLSESEQTPKTDALTGVVSYPDRKSQGGFKWDTATKTWVVLTQKSILGLKDFWRRFTPAEREALQSLIATGTAAQKNKFNAFNHYLIACGCVDLSEQYIIDSVNSLPTSVLAAGRAAVILA